MQYQADQEYAGVTNISSSEYAHPVATIKPGQTIIIQKAHAERLIEANPTMLAQADDAMVAEIVALGEPQPNEAFIIADLPVKAASTGSESPEPSQVPQNSGEVGTPDTSGNPEASPTGSGADTSVGEAENSTENSVTESTTSGEGSENVVVTDPDVDPENTARDEPAITDPDVVTDPDVNAGTEPEPVVVDPDVANEVATTETENSVTEPEAEPPAPRGRFRR